MRKIIATGLLLLSSIAFAEPREAWVEGVVKKVDTHKVTLKHGDIPNVMPAMTMSYPLAVAPTELHVGDKVRFMLEQGKGDYRVTRIEVIKQGR